MNYISQDIVKLEMNWYREIDNWCDFRCIIVTNNYIGRSPFFSANCWYLFLATNEGLTYIQSKQKSSEMGLEKGFPSFYSNAQVSG